MGRLFSLTCFIAWLLLLWQAEDALGRGFRSDNNGDPIRIVSYNVGAFSKYGDSCSLIASMMKELEADVVILNELDSCNARNGYYQLERFAGEIGGWDYEYARAMPYKGGAYGNGIAYGPGVGKALESFCILLEKSDGSEDRVCLVIEFEKFVLAGTHLEVRSEKDRLRGVEKITDTLKARYAGSGKPVFLCGDMNEDNGGAAVLEFEKNWDILSEDKDTYPSDNPKIRIDYILALKNTGEYSVSGTEVCSEFKSGDVSKASDHLPVYADIIIHTL